MTDSVDRIYFEELSHKNPAEVCRRAMCSYNDKEKYYTISIWDVLYKIFPERNIIECDNEKSERLHSFFDLFIVYYLLKAKEIEVANQWISEKDIPGGSTFFRGPHEIPTGLITDQFGSDIETFKKRCRQLKGNPLDMADASFVFKIAPRVPVAVLYWEGDDEFPAESKILYDKTIIDHLPPDIILALVVGICDSLGKSVG